MSEEEQPASITPEVREQWLAPARTERVEAFTYSLWKGSRPRPAKIPRFSRTFSLGVPVLLLAFTYAGRYVVEQMLAGNILPVRVFAVLLGAFLYGSLAATGIGLMRRQHRKRPLEIDSPPQGVPLFAVAARASVGRRGATIGWLWFEADALCFQGIDFDFRIKRSDDKTNRTAKRMLDPVNGMLLRGPKGISPHRLFLAPGFIADGQFFRRREGWKGLDSEISAWERGTASDVPSLLPPVRPVPRDRFRLTWQSWISPPLYMGFLFLIVGWTFPTIEGMHRSPLGFAFAGVFLGLMWLSLLWSENSAGNSLDRELEKVLGRPNRMG